MSLSFSLHVLARAPVPGKVKTRLIPALGAEGACSLQRLLLERTLALPAGGFAERFLWLDDAPDASLQHLAESLGWTLMEQPVGDLGERMRRIAVLGLAEGDGVVLIGNDCPLLDVAYLGQACAALEQHPAVLGPAEDGGYVLLGLRQVDSLLFSAIPWGSEHVLDLTRTRLQQLAWTHHELQELWDVDRPCDLARLEAIGIRL